MRSVPATSWRWRMARPRSSNSLRTGNLTGNFSGFGPFGRFLRPIDQINQGLAPQFPEPARTGNFFAGTGNFERRIRELGGGSGNLDSRRRRRGAGALFSLSRLRGRGGGACASLTAGE